MLKPPRNHPGYGAFLAHRISGVLLAAFLPAHFWVLGLVLQGEAALDGFLRWTESPLVKAMEVILVALLATHLAGGLRLLLIELTPWRDGYDTLVAVTAGVALAAGLLVLLGVL